jgi:predicted DNA-binding transcriptional regulator AlpA
MTSIPTHSPRLRTDLAAEYCGSTKSTFEKYRLTGEGPAYIKLGRVVVYDRDDLDAWLASNRRMSTSEPEADNE